MSPLNVANKVQIVVTTIPPPEIGAIYLDIIVPCLYPHALELTWEGDLNLMEFFSPTDVRRVEESSANLKVGDFITLIVSYEGMDPILIAFTGPEENPANLQWKHYLGC